MSSCERCTREITGREVVLSGFFSSIGVQPYHEVTAAMVEKTNQVLELLEAGHLADREMTGMSSGEAHRLLIGRALVHDPLALLLDEPSNSLDFRAALELRDTLRKLAQAGTGILMVTHHLLDILPEIDRVILLCQGRVFADGAKSEVLTVRASHRIVWPSREACAARRLLSALVIRLCAWWVQTAIVPGPNSFIFPPFFLPTWR